MFSNWFNWWFGDDDSVVRFIGGVILHVMLVVTLIAGAIGLLSDSVNTNPGDGHMIGRVTQVHTTGVFCKTTEMWLSLSNLNNGTGTTVGTTYSLTVTSKEQADTLISRMVNKLPVEVTYHTKGFYSPCSSAAGGDFITSVK